MYTKPKKGKEKYIMKNIKKLLLVGTLIVTSLQADKPAGLSLNPTVTQQPQDKTALNIIQTMQECINLNQKVQQQVNQSLNASQIQEQKNLWEQAVQFITDLHKQSNSTDTPSPIKMDQNNQLMMQINKHRNLFSELLNEYITHFGQLYEKQGSLFERYKTSYYLSSKDDKKLSITPDEYNLLVQTLENAAKQANWKKTIELSLLVAQEDDSFVKKTLTLSEIVTAMKQIPLPIGYLTIAAGVGTAAAIGAGAYYAYNNYTQGLNNLEEKVDNISDALEAPTTEESSTWWEKFKDNAEVNAQNADLATFAAAGADSELTPVNLQNAETPEEVTRAVQDYVIPAANIASIAVPAAQAYKAARGIAATGVASTAATGVGEGITLFGTTKPTIPTFPTSTVKTPTTIKPLTPTTNPVEPSRLARQFEHLPKDYIKPTTTPRQTPISPNWETYFGR